MHQHLPTYRKTGVPCDPPQPFLFATTYYRRESIVCTGAAPILETVEPSPTTLQQFLLDAETSLQWCF